MVACIEKTERNSEFHEIVEFLTTSTIHHALTVSPTIYTSYIEQFWNTASSQTINYEKQIHATVDSKAVVVIEASIRSSLLFNDADGTACLTNEAIFQNFALMGYEGGHTSDRVEGALNLEELFSICTSLSNMVLVFKTIKDAQAVEIIALKARIKKLEKKCKPSISHHIAWLKSVQRLSMNKRFGMKDFVSKQGRKKDKPQPTLDDSTFDGLDDDLDADHGMVYMDTEEPVNAARDFGKRERERNAMTTLLMAIPEDHLEKFYKMTDAKQMWEAIKSRFGGNDESKKMQKYLLKQQFESFSVSSSEELHKGYDRFQILLSQLETRGVGVSTEDANQKFLRVFESDVKGSTRSSSSTHNTAFVSSDNTSSTNEVNIAFGVSTSFRHNSQKEGSSSYTDDLMYSFFANQSSGPQLDHEYLKQVDEFNLEEMNLKWQVAMISTRLKKFYKKTRRKLHFDAKEPVGFDKSKVECFNCHNTGHFARECRSKGNQDSRRRYARNTGYKTRDNGKRPAKHKAMVTIDGKDKSAKDKSGFGYGTQIHNGVLSYENEVFACVFDSMSSDVEDNDPKFTYGPKQSTTSESDAKTSDLDSCDSSSSKETLETMPKSVESNPKVVNDPKVWFDASIIAEYESDNDDEHVTIPLKEQEKPGFAFVNTVEHVTPPRFTKKACFVCGSFIHLIRDCDFYDKRMAKQDNPHQTLKGKGIVDSGCFMHMTGNKAYLVDYQDFNGGPVAFGGSKGQITENIVPFGGLACLIAKSIVDESTKWHRSGSKGIKREYSNARTAQQNGVAKRKNKTLIEAARTMLAYCLSRNVSAAGPSYLDILTYANQDDSHIPSLEDIYEFPNDGISTSACYDDEGAMADFTNLESTVNPITAKNKANKTEGPKETNNGAGTQDSFDAGNSNMEAGHAQEYYVLPLWSSYTSTIKSSKAKNGDEKLNEDIDSKINEELVDQEGTARASSTNYVNTASTPVNAASTPLNTASTPTNQDDSQIPSLEDIYEVSRDEIFTSASYDDEGAVVDFTNLETTVNVSPIPTSRIHSIHPTTQILRDPTSAVQTRSKVNKSSGAHAFVTYIQKQRRNNHKDFQHYLFACFLSQIEPKKISQALEYEIWVDVMQEKLLQFKIQKV
nr:ribonuclease H-like domain-containing protein [Tanacetum cinerariifolium]